MGRDTLKALAPYVTAILLGAGGFAGGNVSDVLGARSWKATMQEELERSHDLERRVVALEAQQEMALELLTQCYSEAP